MTNVGKIQLLGTNTVSQKRLQSRLTCPMLPAARMLMLQDTALSRHYYWTALTALRFLDERSGRRRFGPDADARWDGFAGDAPASIHGNNSRIRILSDADRIDLLLRDADIQWPGAFGARAVFDLAEIPEDDAFGHDWVPYDDAATLWHQVTLTPLIPDLTQLSHRICTIWDTPLTLDPLPPLHPNTRWLLQDPSSVAAAIGAFAADSARVWHSQVLVVAGSPLEAGLSLQQRRIRGLTRQLAALAAGLLSQSKPTRILNRTPATDEYRGYERPGSSMEVA
jgi:hypothetical protein